MTDLIMRAIFIGVFVALAVELVVMSGAWDRLAVWWRKHSALYVDDDDAPVITSLFEYRKGRGE